MKTLFFIFGAVVGCALFLGVEAFIQTRMIKAEMNQLYLQNSFLQKQCEEFSHKFDVSMALLEQIENDRKKEW